MRPDSLQMEPTFREEVIAGRDHLVKKYPKMRWAVLPVSGAVLGVHRLYEFFHQRVKKVSGIAMVAAAFAVSSSFTFPVLSMRAGFVALDAGQTAVMAQTSVDSISAGARAEESSVEFAVMQDPTLLEDPTLLDLDEEGEDAAETENSESEVGGVEAGSNLGEIVTMEQLLGDGSVALAEYDDGGDGEAGFSEDDWRLILVNKQHPIPADYEINLGDINASMQCDSRIIGNLREMFRAASEDGVSLVVCSPYRTHTHQVELFDRKINRYMKAGLSYMEAYTMAAQAVTVPGTSEHEIGLAIDIVSDSYNSLNAGFGQTPAGIWLAANSTEYGFILRYPEGKETITGIEFEPWHFRYVGREAAKVMQDENICLEEFWDEYLYHSR